MLQAHSLSDKIHRIDDGDANDTNYGDLVHEFLLQTVHEPIAISANGFFTIDFQLLGSVRKIVLLYFYFVYLNIDIIISVFIGLTEDVGFCGYLSSDINSI